MRENHRLIRTHRRSPATGLGLGLALALGLANPAAHAVERTGKIEDIQPRTQVLVVNDAMYTVNPGTVVRHAKGRTVDWQRVLERGQYVSFEVDGDGRAGVITAIRVLPGPPRPHSE